MFDRGAHERKADMENRKTLTIADFCKRYRIGRTKVYEEINFGRLRAIKVGRRTLIVIDDAEAWLQSQSALIPQRAHIA